LRRYGVQKKKRKLNGGGVKLGGGGVGGGEMRPGSSSLVLCLMALQSINAHHENGGAQRGSYPPPVWRVRAG